MHAPHSTTPTLSPARRKTPLRDDESHTTTSAVPTRTTTIGPQVAVCPRQHFRCGKPCQRRRSRTYTSSRLPTWTGEKATTATKDVEGAEAENGEQLRYKGIGNPSGKLTPPAPLAMSTRKNANTQPTDPSDHAKSKALTSNEGMSADDAPTSPPPTSMPLLTQPDPPPAVTSNRPNASPDLRRPDSPSYADIAAGRHSPSPSSADALGAPDSQKAQPTTPATQIPAKPLLRSAELHDVADIPDIDLDAAAQANAATRDTSESAADAAAGRKEAGARAVVERE